MDCGTSPQCGTSVFDTVAPMTPPSFPQSQGEGHRPPRDLTIGHTLGASKPARTTLASRDNRDRVECAGSTPGWRPFPIWIDSQPPMHRPINHALAALDPIARALGGYSAYRIGRSEWIETVRSLSLEELVAALEEAGYRDNHLAAAKYHPAPHAAVDHASLRRVPDEHPDLEVEAEITTEWAPHQCQYHVHLWPTLDGVEVFGHYELRPDLHPVAGEYPLETLKRLRTHYRPEHHETYLHGISDIAL